MRTCVKWEVKRLVRQTRFWISLGVLVGLGEMFSYGYELLDHRALLISTVGLGISNGFFAPFLALSLSSSVLLPFFVALFAGDSVAGERQSGTWTTLLTTGISPWPVYWAKWIVSSGYAVLATLLLTGSSLAGGWILLGLHGSALPSGVMASSGQFWRLLGIATLYGMAGQMVVAAYATTVSAFNRHSVSSLMAIMGSLIVLAMLGDLPVLTRVRHLFFTSYFSRVSDALSFPTDWTALNHGLIVYGFYLLAFLVVILWFQPFRE